VPLTIECTSCQKPLKVREEQRGRRAKCPACGSIIEIAAPVVTAVVPRTVDVEDEPLPELPDRAGARSNPSALMKQVLGAFHGDFQRPRVTVGYLMSLAFVAGASAALVTTYLGLVAGAGYAVYWHAVTNTRWMSIPGRAGAFVILCYVLLLLLGVIMVLFMLKPLFARPGRGKLGRHLELSEEPIVYSFVAKLAEVVGAPEPAEIRINSSANAAASMGGGLLSLFSRRLTLVLGMPLVAGLDAQQFAGVVAHELGHFSQGAGSRVSGFIRGIQGWLAQGAYGGDEWDDWFSDLADEEFAIVALFGMTCQFGVFLVRLVFYILLVLSVLASFFLMRQMEYDADRYEALVAGTPTFAKTTQKLLQLNVAESAARNMLAVHDVPEDPDGHFPGLVTMLSRQMPKDLRNKLKKHAKTERTSWFSTHPADADRIKNVERLNAPGIFQLQMPAKQLFLHFDKLAKDASPKSYKRLLAAREV
jgi:Zn-dependent protease with chaperone function